MTFQIVKATPAHLRAVGQRATRPAAQRFIDLQDDHGGAVDFFRLCDTAWSLACEGQVFGVVGYLAVAPGHAVAWAMFSADVARVSPVALTRKVGSGISSEMERSGIHRLESAIDVADGAALRWSRILGFEIEGLMRKSGSGQTDQWLIARIMQ